MIEDSSINQDTFRIFKRYNLNNFAQFFELSADFNNQQDMWLQTPQTERYFVTACEVIYEEANGLPQSTSFVITRSTNETILNQVTMPNDWQIRSTSK